MGRRKTLVLAADHKWRDVAGLAWAKCILEDVFGHRVVVARSQAEKSVAFALGADAVVLSQILTADEVDTTKRLSEMGVAVVVLAAEGIPPLRGTLDLDRLLDERHIDLYFAWGPLVRRAVESGPNPPKRVEVIGVPRFDFYREPLSALLMTRERFAEKYGLTLSGPLIFAPTNFTQAMFHGWNEQANRDEWQRTGLDRVFGKSADEVAREDYRSRAMWADAVTRLLSDFPDAAVVVKPHPNESHTFWKSWHADMSDRAAGRVALVTQEYIWDVLNVADVVLGRNCTTTAEAWLLDKPTIECRLNPVEDWFLADERIHGSYLVQTYEELRDAVNACLTKPVPDALLRARTAFVAEWCPRTDGGSTWRFANVLSRFLEERPRPALRWDFSRALSAAKVVLNQATDFRLADWRYGRWRRGSDRYGRTDKWVYPSDVAMWQRRLAPLVGAAIADGENANAV